MTPSARNRMSTPGFDISRRCYNATMAISIWRWRRTMLEKARSTARMVSRRFAKLATTSRKYRMLISAQARDAWKACGAIRAQSVRNPIRAAESFSQTSEVSRFSEYKLVASSFPRVTLFPRHPKEVPAVLFGVGDPFWERGDRFGRSSYQVAVDT